MFIIDEIQQGAFPSDDGWGGLYRSFDKLAQKGSLLHKLLCAYYLPNKLERFGGGLVYRLLGVTYFGRFIPTGGINIRRVTGAKMNPYTLSGRTIRATRDFYYRTCVFETLHFPFFIALVALSVHRVSIGRIDWATKESLINLLVNLYPMLHHRNTRRRILEILYKKKRLNQD